MQKYKVLIAGGLALVIVAAAGAALYTKSKKVTPQSHPTYSLNLMKNVTYKPGEPAELKFNIIDQNKTVLKDFDTVHEKIMHLIVVRKDRTNFQHVHPNFDQKTGLFAITNLRFPTDGEYRVFADFTPTGGQMDATGIKLPATPYQDVTVGNMANYHPQPNRTDQLTSTANGLQTTLTQLEHDTVNETPPEYTAGIDTGIVVSVKKNGQPFTRLENYLGALGHMVVLGPNLEFIHAHPAATKDQTGYITFSVLFPDPGKYKLFLQTQSEGRINTTEFATTVKGMPRAQSPSEPSMNVEHSSYSFRLSS